MVIDYIQPTTSYFRWLREG